MTPLDLSLAPPRGPRERMPGLDLVMLARTVDKLRASLPGGDLGPYKISGFSTRLMEALGIAEDDLREVVAAARDDAEIAAWVRAHSDPSAYPEFNAAMEALTLRERLEDPSFVANNPIVKNLTPDTKRFDFLELDDAAMFPAPGR